MKILIVAGYFPPRAPSAATRINKLAKYLIDHGHDVQVLTEADLPFPSVLTPEISLERVHYTPMVRVAELPETLLLRFISLFRSAGRGNGDTEAPAKSASPDTPENGSKAQPGRLKRALRPLRDLFLQVVEWPDGHIGWFPFAIKQGRQIIADWKPDLIYASAPPHTSSVVARGLSRRTGVPWICELRDLWVDHPYYDAPGWRRWLEGWHERRVLGSARALVTVTGPWAKLLEAKYRKPTKLVMNGFDPDDYPENPPENPPESQEAGGPLTLLYTGALYADKRDPEPLFRALQTLGPAANRVRIDFYGPDMERIDVLRRQYGLETSVGIYEPISYQRVVELQRSTDVLLLLRWDNPGENSVIAGKLFEYFGARRPILSVGATEGVVADMIRDRGAGLVSKSPAEIAAKLQEWLALKQKDGRIPALPLEIRQGLSRWEQFRDLEAFLEKMVE